MRLSNPLRSTIGSYWFRKLDVSNVNWRLRIAGSSYQFKVAAYDVMECSCKMAAMDTIFTPGCPGKYLRPKLKRDNPISKARKLCFSKIVIVCNKSLIVIELRKNSHGVSHWTKHFWDIYINVASSEFNLSTNRSPFERYKSVGA